MVGIDVDRARRETPGCASVIHLNNAGAALPPQPVLDAVVGHLRREAEIGGYEAAAEARERVERPYPALAELLNCAADEIAVLENATRAWDMAAYALPFGPDNAVLTTVAEYASNYIALLQLRRRTGVTVEVLPDDEHGQVDVAALRRRLDRGGVALVSLVHVPTQGGLVQPAEAVGALCRAAGVPVLLDACQSAGQLPLDVQALGCDMLSATGRKYLRAPRGTGFLYVRRPMLARLEPVFLDLHAAEWTAPGRYRVRADARRFESWECSAANKIGLGVAADYAMSWGIDAIAARTAALAGALREGLGGLPGVAVHDRGERRCGIVTFTVRGLAASEVAERLRHPPAGQRPINVTYSTAADNRLDLGRRSIDALVRASVHYYNTGAELDTLVQRVGALARS